MATSADKKPPAPKIGELLIKDGLVKKEDIERALEIQKEEIKESELPLGMLLVKNGLITKNQLQRLLDHPYLRKYIGKLAIEKGLINETQLEECLNKKKPDEMIGQVLIKQGYATSDDIKGLLNQQIAGTKLGQLALKFDMITQKDLDEVLNRKNNPRILGEILCSLDLISPIDLTRFLKKYNKQQRLGEILVKQGIINKAQLNEALYEQKHRAEFLGNILLEKKFITSDELYYALSKQYNIEFRKLGQFDLSQDQINTLVSFIGLNYAEKNKILPLSREGNRLVLGLSDVTSLKVVHELSAMYSHLKIDCVLITDADFKNIFKSLYGKSLKGLEQAEEIQQIEDVDSISVDLEDRTDLKDISSEAYGVSDVRAQEVVNYIIRYGILKNASDIHIERDRETARLRYRIDGVLQTLRQDWLDEKLQTITGAIVSRIKVMSNLDIAERRLPQDGAFRITYVDKENNKKVDVDLRVAICPAIVGENITIRILDSRTAKVGLENLGHSKHVLNPFKTLLKSPAGMVLVTGPTGSGKTSTLYGALQFIYNPGIKIVTAEDPIEYSIPGIMQTQIHTKINLTFARLLRSFLRSDPDIILVGEMRDEETANIGFDAVQTGHLLLSTLHTNDAVGAISRLRGLDVDPNQIAAGLMGVLAQRLLRRICTSCSTKYVPTKEEWSLLFNSFPSDFTFYRAKGCELCDFTGYNGRILISEFFVMNEDIIRALITDAGENEIKRIAINGGMKTMLDDAILKLDQTTLSEIIRIVPHEMIKEFKSRPEKR
ncbi:MAG: Flp pilus assembly complex ATPase component TadA [Deltaproteobacteria bacterium]|nr:Flp pilus assembly complex ATPase component TadA [Deltaproteobacteria bacterium]